MRLILMRSALVCSLVFCTEFLFGQGCVAIRPMSCSTSTNLDQTGYLKKGQWQFQSSYRYFESFRHFRGSEEESNRIDDGTQVINDSYALDLGLNRMLTDRFSLSINVPVIYYTRSSLYEHYGNSPNRNPDHARFSTGSSGIGDIRLTADYWLFDPTNRPKGNLFIGLGIKTPTGNENVMDQFHRRTEDGGDTTITKPVDQSIQLGDGGWGFVTQFQGFRYLTKTTTVFFNGFYLFNPRNTNNTLSRGTLEGVNPLVAYHSVADQYAARMGINTILFPKYEILGGLGGRIEGIPSKDLIGDSEGYRRPGYVISVEPSLTVPYGEFSFTLSVPIALYRNRVKSQYDLSDPTGQRHGDAAFADYLINMTVGYRF